ncbi:7-carboxy-7-deazaguanine synthase QueE [Streptomyces scabiei]|uniref:7-carboxy-7-deazaguanine synthase QueE n=1 Tax=Streptomyces scabiei TaxID=1930 RepID=UPI0038F6C43C
MSDDPAVLDLSATLVVAETFGPTLQGEGPSCGRRCSFVRLGGCNLKCTWCDTPETWDASRYDLRQTLTRRTVADIMDRLMADDPMMVVITGGEPLLHQQQPGWTTLLHVLNGAGVEVEVETNGTVPPTPYTAARVTRFNVSPKLTHAGDPEHKRINGKALAVLRWTNRAAFKFVCATAADVEEAARFVIAYNLPPRRVWIMPEGTDRDDVHARLQTLAEPAIAAGFNLTTRLHISLWGDEKGR